MQPADDSVHLKKKYTQTTKWFLKNYIWILLLTIAFPFQFPFYLCSDFLPNIRFYLIIETK